ncbi:MAG: FAD-dependent monooxygenase [Burkholderiaceae bacterium]|jgi:3-(3-hydroxy-phenyl)propionate hydroxylase|nr:FAD-dependent monooxygenase [Burkholderiaceae bacterium]
MHKPSTEPRHSIYYDYKIYPYHRPPELDAEKQKHPVVLVGAGPIGLVAALELASFGVRSVLLESERQVSLGSRAICFTRRSMEILQQAGVDKPLTAAGLPWRYGNSHYRGQRTFRLDMPYDEDDRFHPMLNLQQQYLEEYLADAVAKQPLIDLRWGHHVTGVVRNDDHGAMLRVDTQDGPYDIEADWVVATDGARSGVRGLLGLTMQGDAYEGRFVIADIRVDLDLPTERLAFFDPPWNPGNTVLMHREPHGIWRIDFQLPPGETPEQALALESLAPRIDAQLALIGKAGVKWELDWSSVYSARAMTLPDYRAGRILFSGDAAHMLPIFGVRGANTGWQDGQNLAWKLAFVIRGLAPDHILRSYSEERVGAAWEIIDEASKSTRFMTPPSHGFRLLRDAVLSLSLTQEFVRPLYHWRTSRPHEYLNSNLNAAGDDNDKFARGPRNGAQLDNIKLGAEHYLLDHAGAAFQLIYFGALIPQDVYNEAAALKASGLPLQLIAVVPAGGPAAVGGADLTLHDASGHFYAKYGATEGTAYLARPDQHVCARWLQADGTRIAAAVKTALAQ